MRALSGLIALNAPDLVLFVGEALVGNDAVDQLSKFNSRLADLAPDAATAHGIDGILLTKFDTIDDKVWGGSCLTREATVPACAADSAVCAAFSLPLCSGSLSSQNPTYTHTIENTLACRRP